jgi:Holliday junction DNA helicase RuvB
VYIQAASQRAEALDHVLLFGPPGLGKTTLAGIIAKEMNVNIKMSSGPVLDRPGDLAGILTNLAKQDVFFIDEIHRLSSVVEEYLYSAMEDFTIDIMLDKGPSARSVQLTLNPFTLVGATTRLGNLTSPMRDRFGVVLRLDFYGEKDLLEIIMRSAGILEIEIDEDGAGEIARRSRGTPRIANRILRRARDFAQIKSDGIINIDVAQNSLSRLGIDTNGLDDMDRRILTALVEKFNGGPVGLESLGVAISEDARTIEEVYEPYLIKEGFIQRTSRGRKALDKTFVYLDAEKPASDSQVKIF